MCKVNVLFRRGLLCFLPRSSSLLSSRNSVCFCSPHFRQLSLAASQVRSIFRNCHSALLLSNGSIYTIHSSHRESVIRHKHVQQERIREVLQEKKERFKETGQVILKDIRDTKNKVKERMEEIVERENVWTIPNLLCVSRIAISPYLGYVITQSEFHLALGLFAFAGITDLVDGWIARTYPSQATKIGSFLDPMADKVLVAILFLTLTYMDFIPVPLTGMIIIRDLLLVGAGFYIRYQSLPAPKTLARYFDVTHATAQLAPTFISKVNTAIQLTLIATTLAAPVFDYVDHPLLHALWYVTAGTTIASAWSYVVSQNTYKFLKRKK
ncbi:probable cardiolipin synthase (CMP-forming) [Anabrus simplex]|uniref:probable cardiolipin synthase (CMP-forming) n=1 Tax=Anabrus simplex TaxID=316456 RepID=UPI0035A362F1